MRRNADQRITLFRYQLTDLAALIVVVSILVSVHSQCEKSYEREMDTCNINMSPANSQARTPALLLTAPVELLSLTSHSVFFGGPCKSVVRSLRALQHSFRRTRRFLAGCFVLAYMVHPHLNNRKIPDMAWTAALSAARSPSSVNQV